MKKSYQMTFFKSEFIQYKCILEDEEIRNKIADFVLKYVSIEAFYKKMLIAEKESSGKKLSQKERKNLNVTVSDVKRVLMHFGLDCDLDLIERIFGSNDKNYMDCSVKKLRDRLVHNVNENVLRVVLERYDKINADLESFIELITSK